MHIWLHGSIAFPLPDPPLTDPGAGIGLRAWGAPGDAEALAAAWADREVQRWSGAPADRSMAPAERWIAGEPGRRDAELTLDLVIHDLSDPAAVLGEVGLVLVDADRRWAEAGWWLTAEARGGGGATAAVRLVTPWALDVLHLSRLFARTDPANPAAGRVAQRAGWRLAGAAADGRDVWVAVA